MITKMKHHSITTVVNENYSILTKIGSGEFGDVYEAIQRSTEQRVAVKIIRLHESDTPDIIKKKKSRFLREMKICKELDHPGIVRVLDSGTTVLGHLYTVFELIPGKTLAAMIRDEGPLTLIRATTIMIQILDALSVAHKNGIIHRDLKPDNIMIASTGLLEQVKILDFGCSTGPDNFRQLTSTSGFIGTPAYAAPEQLRGETVTEKADLYAWGLIFLECITGKHPYEGSTGVQLIQKQLSPEAIPIPQQIMNHHLGILLQWVLDKNKARRAGNAERIISRLKNIPFDTMYISDTMIVEGIQASLKQNDAITTETILATVACYSLQGSILTEQTHKDTSDTLFMETVGQCKKIIRECGGFIESASADGSIVAVFGYPRVLETDARMAVHSALQISVFLKRQNILFKSRYEVSFSMDCGIVTNNIYVKKNETLKNCLLYGSAFKSARALCNGSGTQGIEIKLNSFCHSFVKANYPCKEIYDAAGNLIYLLEGTKTSVGIGGSKKGESVFIGRRKELEILQEASNAIHCSPTRMLYIKGEAGIGKSRLLSHFASMLKERSYSWLEFQFTPETEHNALYPFLQFIKELWKISPGKENESIIAAEIPAYCSCNIPVAVPLLCAWLGIPNTAYPPLQQSPLKQKELLFDILLSIIITNMKRSAPVVFCEDLHWADPVSIEFLSKFFQALHDNQLLGVATGRLEFNPPWDAHMVRSIQLKPLSCTEIEKFIQSTRSERIITVSIKNIIVDKCDGNPLFMEEFIRMISEMKQKTEELSFQSISQIPSTLKGIVCERLDRIGKAKKTAQLASVLGRQFSYSMIAEISVKEEAELLADLDELVSAGILDVGYYKDDFSYSFHHAVICDATYENIAREFRIEMHTRIAHIIESRHTDIICERPELLAYHWRAAEVYDAACKYGILAANNALMKSSHEDAIIFSKQVIEMCHHCADSIDVEITANNLLIQALMFRWGFAYSELFKILSRNSFLLNSVKTTDVVIQTLWNKSMVLGVSGNRREARLCTEQLRGITEALPSRQYYYASLALLGHNTWMDGDYAVAQDCLQKVVNSDEPACATVVFGFHVKIWAQSTLADISWFLDLDDAKVLSMIDECIQSSRQAAHIPSLGIALWHKALICQYFYDKKAVSDIAEEMLNLSHHYGLTQYECFTHILLAWAQGDIWGAKNALSFGELIGTRNALSYYTSLIADIAHDCGDYAQALSVNQKALNLCHEMEEYYYEPELLRKRALYLLHHGGTDSNPGIKEVLSQALLRACQLKMVRCEKMISELISELL